MKKTYIAILADEIENEFGYEYKDAFLYYKNCPFFIPLGANKIDILIRAVKLCSERYDKSRGATIKTALKHFILATIDDIKREDKYYDLRGRPPKGFILEDWQKFCQTVSIDSPLDEEKTLHDIIASEYTAASILSEEERRQVLLDLLNKLSNKKASKILCMRFGFEGDFEKTLEKIGNELNLTAERVRQIEQDALKELKRRFALKLQELRY